MIADIKQFHDAFEGSFDGLPEAVQDALLAQVGLSKQFGPSLGRPRIYTLKGSRHANMKELRFDATGRMEFCLRLRSEPRGDCAGCGDKSGWGEGRFYRQLVRKADARFDEHVARLERERR